VIKTIIKIGLLLMIPLQVSAKLPPQGISGGAASANVYLMLDTSGSMGSTAPGGIPSPFKGGLQSGSQVQLAEYDSTGQLWLYDAAYGQFKVSSNGSPIRSISRYSNYIPQSIKRQGSNILVLYYVSSSTRMVVRYSSSGTVLNVISVGGTSSGVDQICAIRNGTTAYLVDALGYHTVNFSSNTASSRRAFSYSGSRPYNSFNGCANVGSQFIVSSTSYGTYYFNPSISSVLIRSSSNVWNELTEDPVNANGMVGIYNRRSVYRGGSTGILGSLVLNFPTSATSYALALSPVNNQMAYVTTEPQVYIYSNNALSDRYMSSTITMSRLDVAKQVISDILRDSEFNKRANFGLMTWNTNFTRVVDISSTSNAEILSRLPGIGLAGLTYLGTAMNGARSYLNSANFSTSASTCSKTIIIVISDGGWSDPALAESVAADLKAKGIESHVIGFALGNVSSADQKKYNDFAIKGGSSPNSPMFANDMAQLKDKLKQALYVALASAFTSVAPTVMPATDIGNIVIQPTFEYNATGQWKGFLKAYSLNSDLDPSSLLWEFGSKLDLTHPNSRRLWTVSPGLTSPSLSSYNNVTTANVSSSLRTAILGSGPTATDADATTLINFIRGFDSYDENSNGSTSDFRWKLQDIYHSRPVFVGRPRSSIQLDANYAGAEKHFETINPGSYARFYEANKTRREIVLAGANSGILHAIDAATGQEVWGFIPPPILRKLSELPSTNANSGKKSSIGIYGIDGNLTVRDVYVGGAWRTYAAITFGQGARAFTVIDVTNPDTPSHVFSIENRYENGIWVVNRWDSSGNLSVNPSSDSGLYSYKSLGYTTSSPLFAFLNDIYGRYVPTLILGAGSNSGLDATSGNVVYFIDIDGVDAGVVTERTPVGPFPYANLPVNDLSTDIEVIESGRSERMKGRYGVEMFIPNSNGVLQTVDFSGASSSDVNLQNNPKTIFHSETTISNDRLITSPISISTTTSRKYAGDLNLIFGTGDMDRLAIYGTNPDNYIYSIQKTEAELMSPSVVLTRGSLANAATNSTTCPLPNGSQGWKIAINSLSGPSKTGAAINTTSGKLASKIVQYGSSALISVYSPLTTNACSMGNSCFFERDSACGYSKNSACFANMMIGGVSTFQDKIFIGVSGNQGKETLGSGFARTDNLVVGKGYFTNSSSGSINVYGRQRKR
jgi:uncharacterized protein YegL